MLKTEYTLPFVCEVPRDNPWDGRRAVQLWLEPKRSDTSDLVSIATRWLQPFWALAGWGALAGPAGTPRVLALPPPRLELHGLRVGFTFEPCQLDERASHVLLSALLAGDHEAPLKHVRLGAADQQLQPIEVVERLAEPYPSLPRALPFACAVEDSEDETRVLTLKPTHAFDTDQQQRVRIRLEGWAAAVNAGTFGVAPVSPRDCDCVPEDVQTFEDEVYWPLEKCRFHPAALECLVALCAALHHEAPIDHCRID